MDRPKKPIGRPPSDIPPGPLAKLAGGLRALKAEAELSFAEMSAITHYSVSILSTAAAGRRLPSWSATEQYVQACGASPDDWRPVWTAAAEELAKALARVRSEAEQTPTSPIHDQTAAISEEPSQTEHVVQLSAPGSSVAAEPQHEHPPAVPRTPSGGAGLAHRVPRARSSTPLPWPGNGPRQRDGTVAVAYKTQQWLMAVGEELTIGRSNSCDIRLPQEDSHLSRRAARLENQGNLVLIHNIAATKPIALRPPAGEDRVIEPGAAIASLPYRRFAIVLPGGLGDLEIAVDARGLRPPPGGPETPPGWSDVPEDFDTPNVRTRGQHRVLVALCRPILTRSGAAARPATYTEIGQELGLSPQYVRNVIKSIREDLTGDGVPGLANEPGAPPSEDYRAPLAHFAVRHGLVSPADLTEPMGDL